MSAAFARKLAEAGMSATDIVSALEAYEAAEEERKSKVRDRKRRQRERDVTGHSVTSRDVTGQGVTERDTPSLPPSPQTPQPPTHPRDETTPAHVRAAEPVLVVVSATDWPEGDCRRHADLLASEANTHRLDPTKTEGLLLTSARLAAWRAAGASWEFDVVPTVKALSARSGRAITSWKFFDDAVAQSIANNRAALSIPEAQTHASQAHDRISASQSARRENRDRASSGADWAAEVVAARRAL